MATAEAARTRLEELDLSAALDTIWGFVRRLNRYVEEQAPWKLAKEAGAQPTAGAGDVEVAGRGATAPPRPAADAAAELDATLWDLAEGLRLLTVLLYPFIPETALAIRERLGLDPDPVSAQAPGWGEARWGLLPEAPAVVGGAPLFPRIED